MPSTGQPADTRYRVLMAVQGMDMSGHLHGLMHLLGATLHIGTGSVSVHAYNDSGRREYLQSILLVDHGGPNGEEYQLSLSRVRFSSLAEAVTHVLECEGNRDSNHGSRR